MKEPVPPSKKEQDDSLEDLDLPLLAAWTALSPETKARLGERFRTCRPGTRFILVTRPIEGPDFHTRSTHRVLFTWGFETVWLQEYRPESV